jgi:hypothetical protein
MGKYNATVRRLDARTGHELGVFRAEIDDEGRMLRSTWLKCTGFEGTPAYHELLLRSGDRFDVERVQAGG